MTDMRSFQQVREWVEDSEIHVNPKVSKILIGNKADLTDRRVVSRQVAEDLVKELESRQHDGHVVFPAERSDRPSGRDVDDR